MRGSCRKVGWHQWADVRRRDEASGYTTIEGCVACEKSRSVFRPFLHRNGPMRPRVSVPSR
jgi:hypothetical protein